MSNNKRDEEKKLQEKSFPKVNIVCEEWANAKLPKSVQK